MRRYLPLLLAGAASIALGLGAGTAWAGPGQTPAAADCLAPAAGTACVVITGTSDHATTPIRVGDHVAYTFTMVNSGDTDELAANPYLHFSSDLEINRSTVKIDGHAVGVGEGRQGKQQIVSMVDLRAHTTSVLTFTAEVVYDLQSATVPAQTVWFETGSGETSNDVVVSPPVTDLVAQQILNVPAGTTFKASPGVGVTMQLGIDNHGSAAPRSTLQIGIPVGWSIAPAATSPLPCTTVNRVLTCTVPAIPSGSGRGFQIIVKPGASSAVGVKLQIPVRVTPIGAVDEFPSDNSFSYPVVNAGQADLSVAITPSTTQLLKHGLVTFTVKLTNRGPNPSVNPYMVLLVNTRTANGFTQLMPVGPGQIREGGGYVPVAGPTFNWQPGTIPVGHTVTLTVRWQANVLGAAGRLNTQTGEDSYDANNNVNNLFQRVQSGAVNVVAKLTLPPSAGTTATATPTPSPASGATGTDSSAGSGTDPELAATGASSAAPIGWGLGLIALGGLLVGYGRRRITH